VVAITVYLDLLVLRPLLCFLCVVFGLGRALMVVLGLVMVAELVARALSKQQSQPDMENSERASN
ncbi:MFS transporter, partial [Klebsiella pneumoniae]|nr:MFS transporter [Klebsiella pneumoniae]